MSGRYFQAVIGTCYTGLFLIKGKYFSVRTFTIIYDFRALVNPLQICSIKLNEKLKISKEKINIFFKSGGEQVVCFNYTVKTQLISSGTLQRGHWFNTAFVNIQFVGLYNNISPYYAFRPKT